MTLNRWSHSLNTSCPLTEHKDLHVHTQPNKQTYTLTTKLSIKPTFLVDENYHLVPNMPQEWLYCVISASMF